MIEERKIAKENGVDSPVWDTLDDTHKSYNECMHHILDNIKENSLVLVASHNKESVEQAKDKVMGANFGDHRVRFGQLKAFSDQLTGKLVH